MNSSQIYNLNLPCYGFKLDGRTMPSKLWRGYHSIAYVSKSFKIYQSGNASERSRPLRGYASSSVLLGQTLGNPKRKKKQRLVIFGGVMVSFLPSFASTSGTMFFFPEGNAPFLVLNFRLTWIQVACVQTSRRIICLRRIIRLQTSSIK